MSFNEIFKHAWNKAQHKEFCHKKLIKLVENAFDTSKLEELLVLFTEALFGCYISDYADKSSYCARGLEFLAKIAMMITLKCVQPIEITDSNGTASLVYDITLDPFFTNVLKSCLKFSTVDKPEIRFNTCYFIMSLLQNIGNNVEMDYSICNMILDSLVPLLHDPKAKVRIQAIKALVRLQEPSNPDCIVLKSFWILSTDPNSEVRKAILSQIAPHPQSYVKVRMRITDTDPGVRQAAYLKFADLNPKMCLKIIDRNIILSNGLADQNKKIRNIMSETLLPKWLNCFEGDYLLFFRALRLDADENDINNFEKLCTELLDIFLRKNNMSDIVKYLPVNKEDNLIPIQHLRLESVFYWSNLINYLRKIEDGENYLVNILPELTAFSNYIERFIKERSSVTMDEWENLEYQYILRQLFEISSGFDMSDEVGRKTFYALILKILPINKFHQKVIDKMLHVAFKLNTDVGSLTIDLCQIISEIREPLINEAPSEDKLRKQNFEITQLKVKIHQLEINEEDALRKKDFQLAHMVQNEMKECQRELENLKNMYTVSEKVRVSRDDPETLCRCLDILIGLLKIPNITTMCPALQSCRDEFLMPLLSNTTSEILWRFILCLGLFSLMDKDLAFKHTNFLCLPIATYRVVPNCDKLALKTSVACVSDVIRTFGIKVIGMEENSQSESNQDNNPGTSRRKLYSENLSQPEVMNKDDITIEFIIDIIVDMLDDEDEGVRQTASSSICKLIIHNFPVSPELICRLILKWYNPETEKRDAKLHIQLGSIIECFANKQMEAKKMVQKAIVPIISSIVNASGTSPLLEIDIENVLKFLAALTNDVTANIHNEIADNLIEKMLNKPNDACTPYLIKLLTYLELSFTDPDVCKNIIASTEMLADDIVDKIPKKNLAKFREKLLSGLKEASEVMQVEQSEINVTNGTEGNIGDQSSLIRKSLVNGKLNNENDEQLENIDRSARDSEGNQKGNSSSSESDSEDSSVENDSNSVKKRTNKTEESGKRLLRKNVEDTSKGKAKMRKITQEPEEVSKTKEHSSCGETPRNSEDQIQGISNKKDPPVNEKQKRTNDDIVYVKYDYTPEKNAEKLKNSKKISSNSGNKRKSNDLKIISEVVLQKPTSKKKIEGDKPSEESSRSARSSTLKAKDKLGSPSVDSTKERRKNHRRQSNKETTSTSVENGDKQNCQTKQSLRKTSVPSKLKDYIISSGSKQQSISQASPNQTLTQKRTAETPLSIIVNRKSKRLSKSSTEPPTTPNRVTAKHAVETPSRNENTPLSAGGKGSSKSFSKSVTRASNKVKKSRPSLVVGLRKSLKYTPQRSKRHPKTPPKTPKSSLRIRSNQLQKTKESNDKMSTTTIESSKSKKENTQKSILKDNPSTSKNETESRISRVKKSYIKSTKSGDDSCEKKILKKTNISDDNPTSSNRNEKKETVENESNNKKNKLKKQIDDVQAKKNNAEKTKAKRAIPNAQKGKLNKTCSNSNSEEDDHNSIHNSENVFKKPKRNISKEKPKDKINNKSSKLNLDETDGVLQSLNSVMNEINNTSVNRRSSRIADKNINESLSTVEHITKTKGVKRLQQESTHSQTLTRSRMSNRLNESSSSARKKLDFSSFSDETILKTFLQGDEEVLENMSIEDVNSLSNTSHDSKKENLSINTSTTSRSSRKSTLRKRKHSNSPQTPPRKKMNTRYKKN